MYEMDNCKLVPTPIYHVESLYKYYGTRKVNLIYYSRIIECLKFLTNTRPDISYVIYLVFSYVGDTFILPLKAMRIILRYVFGTLDFISDYSHTKKMNLISFSDSYWGRNLGDQKSIFSNCFSLRLGLIT